MEVLFFKQSTSETESLEHTLADNLPCSSGVTEASYLTSYILGSYAFHNGHN